MLTTSDAKIFHRYEPDDEGRNSGNSWEAQAAENSQILAKRYHMVERVKAAKFVGIVVGTLGASCYIGIIRRIQAIVKASGRKVKTFVVGKLNVPKLANFSEVDVFVLVACPLSTLVDSKEYFAPIVTPFELEMALSGTLTWDGQYETDFAKLLPSTYPDANPISDLPEASTFTPPPVSEAKSVVGGMMELGSGPKERVYGGDGEDGGESSRTVAVMHKPEGLLTRSFQGLVVALGETAATKAVPGQSGIARGYTIEETGLFEKNGSGGGEKEVKAKARGGGVGGGGGGLVSHSSLKKAPALDPEEMAAKRAQTKAESLAKSAGAARGDSGSDSDSGSEIEMDMEDLDEFQDALDSD